MTEYINRFLDLLERFVVAAEKRNELVAAGTAGTGHSRRADNDNVSDTAKPDTASASTGSASGAATERSGRTRTRAAAAGTETADAGAQQSAPVRRERTRAGSAATEQQSAGTESTAGAAENTAPVRRQRTRAGAAEAAQETKPKTPAESDTPEQATLRAEIETLCQMAGQVDACNDDVKAFLKDEGWNVASMVPGDDLQFAFDEINTIIDKYFD